MRCFPFFFILCVTFLIFFAVVGHFYVFRCKGILKLRITRSDKVHCNGMFYQKIEWLRSTSNFEWDNPYVCSAKVTNTHLTFIFFLSLYNSQKRSDSMGWRAEQCKKLRILAIEEVLRETCKCSRRIYVFRFFISIRCAEHACIWGRDLRFQPEKTTLLRKSDKVDVVFIIFEMR